MEIVRRRREYRERVIGEVRSWAEKLNFKATVVLIGSYARGDFNLWSDIDILLIADFKTANPLERLKPLEYPPGFEIIPLTPQEFLKLVDRGNQLAVEALSNGVIIRDDMKLFK